MKHVNTFEKFSEIYDNEMNEGFFDSPRSIVDKTLKQLTDEKAVNECIEHMLAVYFSKPSSKASKSKEEVLGYTLEEKAEYIKKAKELFDADPKATLWLVKKNGKYTLGTTKSGKAIF